MFPAITSSELCLLGRISEAAQKKYKMIRRKNKVGCESNDVQLKIKSDDIEKYLIFGICGSLVECNEGSEGGEVNFV